ncbi:hypothetical protein SAMN05444320_10588 [Streptoalloteichus hindustanus]|uniref:Uncharacterized protein n=1 Tax=Streptoalloteichus hindustanus TaxID=2017 RepID=A0A1M5EQD0_STRHI|nr:hypothetical protein SAMN05444320_10588 [Streptoalloteichus hindustanus]
MGGDDDFEGDDKTPTREIPKIPAEDDNES